MGKRENNNKIIDLIHEQIERKGLSGKLDVYPVENTFTRRPRFWKNDKDVCLFKVLLWTLNELENDELMLEIDRRIDDARKHFKL